MIIKNNQLLNTASKIVLNVKIRRHFNFKTTRNNNNKHCKLIENYVLIIKVQYD